MAGSILIGRIPVRYADVALIHRIVAQEGAPTFLRLVQRLTPSWNHYLSNAATLLKETLSFCVTLGLLESTAERAWDDRSFTTAYPPAGLRVRVLALLSRQTEDEQRAFRGIHDTLVELGLYHTSVQETVEIMERSAYGQAFKWNDTKVNFWCQFMSDLGLVLRMPPERLVCSPGTALLLDLLPPAQVPLRPLLGTWHQETFAVFTRLGDVHEGIARALLRLEASGQITLEYASDAVGSVVLCGRRVSSLAPTTPRRSASVAPL